MPLLMCPNDNASMQTVQRGGVEFDMCPTCRGVWLDRGELEKLMALDQGGGQQPATPPPQAYPPPGQPWSQDSRAQQHHTPRYDERGRDHEQRYDKHGRPYRKKKEGFDLFDIFD